MYFSVTIDEKSHLWRQRFPNGKPEQLTFGPTEEDGIAVAPDGSIITSVGTQQSAIWIHDASGERPLSSEGRVDRVEYTARPSYSSDAQRLYYLRRESPDSVTELWQTDLKQATVNQSYRESRCWNTTSHAMARKWSSRRNRPGNPHRFGLPPWTEARHQDRSRPTVKRRRISVPLANCCFASRTAESIISPGCRVTARAAPKWS